VVGLAWRSRSIFYKTIFEKPIESKEAVGGEQGRGGWELVLTATKRRRRKKTKRTTREGAGAMLRQERTKPSGGKEKREKEQR
jgi:hypothetical protein